MRTGSRPIVVLSLLVVLAGCGGLGGVPSSGSGSGTGSETVRLGLAVENGYASTHTFGVRVSEDGHPTLNRSRRVGPGERWHVTNLRSERYDGDYTVVVRVDGKRRFETTGSFRERPGVNRVSGASLVELGGGSSAHYTCAGTVTCYEEHVDR